MNIKDHYSFMSKLYLQQTVLFAVVFIVVILPNIKRTDFFLANMAGVAVFLFMVSYFFRCVYFTFKKNAVSFALVHGAKSLNGNTYLLIPSHNSQTIVEAYSSEGIRRWSILSLKGKERRERLRQLSLGGKGHIFKVHEHGNSHPWYMYVNQNDVVFFLGDKTLNVKASKQQSKRTNFMIGPDCYELKKLYSDRILYKNGKAVMIIKKGLMPVSWQQFFHPNTPQLKINEQLTLEERALCLCLITLF